MEHIHAGNTYRLYDNNGAVRCGWYSCNYNIYNGDYPDQPEGTSDHYSYQYVARLISEMR